MAIQRFIDFTTDAEHQGPIDEAVLAALAELKLAAPPGVKLAYWKLSAQDRYLALIELANETKNPLTSHAATKALPHVIGEHVNGGYPTPQPAELLGAYGFEL